MENWQVPSRLSSPGRTGQSWGCVIYKNFSWAEQSCISVTPGKSAIRTRQGFLSSSSSLLGAECKALFPAVPCQICRVFPPNILLHTAVHRLSFERTWRAGGIISLHSTLYADCFYIMQTYMDTVLFRARVTTLPSLRAIKQKAVHLELERMHFFRDSSK